MPCRAVGWANYDRRVTLVRSKQRVADHGEVFTPPWMVDAMLDLVRAETERVDARVLEPACGNGNFLVPVLRRKLAAVDRKFGRSNFDRRHFALLSVMCTYGIELLADNVAECRENLLAVVTEHLRLEESDDLARASSFVLTQNVVHGDALSMRTHEGEPITFAEWGYVGRGRFQRRDFRYDVLAQMSSFGADTIFAEAGKHEVFTPVATHPPLTMSELAHG